MASIAALLTILIFFFSGMLALLAWHLFRPAITDFITAIKHKKQGIPVPPPLPNNNTPPESSPQSSSTPRPSIVPESPAFCSRCGRGVLLQVLGGSDHCLICQRTPPSPAQ